MEKRILLGSIIAVIILVLVSFTGVVGYQSIKSEVKVSPLFNIRTSRAIDRDNKELNCDYVGKGDTFLLPKRNSKIVLIQKVIDRISRMDDSTFNKFINLLINQLKHVAISEIISTLNKLRMNPDLENDDLTEMQYKINSTNKILYFPSLDGPWFPGCYLFLYLIDLGFVLFFIIMSFLTGGLWTSYPYCGPMPS